MHVQATELEESLHEVLERAAPVQCLSHFSLGTGGALKTTDAKRLAMKCMLKLEGVQDRIIADGKQVICETLKRVYQLYTDSRMLILLAGYKKVYTEKLEPGFVPVEAQNDRYAAPGVSTVACTRARSRYRLSVADTGTKKSISSTSYSLCSSADAT